MAADLNPPLGTTTPEIFMDNVKRADELVNGPAGTVDDRGGEPLDTWRQMMAKNDEVRQNIIPLSKQYMTLAAAQADIANIPEGSTTYYRSPDLSALAIEVMNVDGTLTATGRTMLSEQGVDDKIDTRLVPGDFSPDFFPLFHNGTWSPIWLRDGALDGAGLGPNYREIISLIPNQLINNMIRAGEFSPDFFPIIYDEDGNVSMWQKDGKPDVSGFGENAMSIIEKAAGGDPKYLEGDVFKFLLKKSQIANGTASSLNIAFGGCDSWGEKSTIPQALIDVLGGVYKDPGWISASTRPDAVMAGITLTASGFSIYDGDNEHNNAPPSYGCGPDGNAMYNTGTVATMTWSGVKATDLTLFYYDGTGSFNLVIDGVTVATIVGTNTGEGKKYDVSGLASAAHTVRITTAGDGVVSIFGMYGKDSAAQSGVTVSRMGNGGSTAGDYLNWANWIKFTAQYLDLDMLFMILGTNDFRKSKGTEQYRAGITEIINQFRLATPGICICLISPAQSNANGIPALSAYDNEMRAIAIEQNVSYISGYKLFPKTYDNTSGVWADTLHLSSLGAHVLTSTIKKRFFED